MPRGQTASVKRTRATQGELPGVDVDSRKILEIEQAAEAQQAASHVLSEAHKAHEEAMDNLVAVMEAKKRKLYARVGFGSVTLKPPKIGKKKAKVTLDSTISKEENEGYENGETEE